VEVIANSMKRKSKADTAILHTESNGKLSRPWQPIAISAKKLSLIEAK
jgi:hypothetical protein